VTRLPWNPEVIQVLIEKVSGLKGESAVIELLVTATPPKNSGSPISEWERLPVFCHPNQKALQLWSECVNQLTRAIGP